MILEEATSLSFTQLYKDSKNPSKGKVEVSIRALTPAQDLKKEIKHQTEKEKKREEVPTTREEEH